MNEVICEDESSEVKVTTRVNKTLNEQFQSVFTKEEHANFLDKGPSPYQPMDSIKVSVKGVEKLLLDQKPHKATQPDEIPSFVLKSAAYQPATLLTKGHTQANISEETSPTHYHIYNDTAKGHRT